MDIKEIRRRRDELAKEIGRLVSAFQLEAGVVVDKIRVEHEWSDEKELPYLTSVDLKIALEPGA